MFEAILRHQTVCGSVCQHAIQIDLFLSAGQDDGIVASVMDDAEQDVWFNLAYLSVLEIAIEIEIGIA
ncbi:hypothetical protein [Desulfonatronum thiosulfatophilum]|uniref:hypothetical protein n=1 Tax=Desulfonatronum thiosulfatophilum TaxID=617002 RepID=UPI001113CEDE|nr:hypothetical protein [Desulfonatronum thiosulfatophilum]